MDFPYQAAGTRYALWSQLLNYTMYYTNYYAEKANIIWNKAKAECTTHRLPTITSLLGSDFETGAFCEYITVCVCITADVKA